MVPLAAPARSFVGLYRPQRTKTVGCGASPGGVSFRNARRCGQLTATCWQGTQKRACGRISSRWIGMYCLAAFAAAISDPRVGLCGVGQGLAARLELGERQGRGRPRTSSPGMGRRVHGPVTEEPQEGQVTAGSVVEAAIQSPGGKGGRRPTGRGDAVQVYVVAGRLPLPPVVRQARAAVATAEWSRSPSSRQDRGAPRHVS